MGSVGVALCANVFEECVLRVKGVAKASSPAQHWAEHNARERLLHALPFDPKRWRSDI